MTVRRSSPYFSRSSAELGGDDGVDTRGVGEDGPVLGNPGLHLGQLVANLLLLQRCQATELEGQDGLGLGLGELESRLKSLAGLVAVSGRTDGGNDRVELIERFRQPFQDVGPGLGLAQVELSAPADDLAAMLDVVTERHLEGEDARLIVDQSQQVDGNAVLQLRVLEQLIEHMLRMRVALELDHQAHALAIRLVAQVCYAFDLALLHQLGDAFLELGLVHLERQLRDDDRRTAAVRFLEVVLAAQNDTAASGGVGVSDAFLPQDDAAGREVGPLDYRCQLGDGRRWVAEQVDDAVDQLAQVVRWDVGCHAYGNPVRAVQQ